MQPNIGLVATSTANQVVGQNENVQFNTAVTRQGIDINNNIATLRITGQYLVTFNASGTGTVAATTATLQLMANGVPVTGAKSSVQDAETTDVSSFGFTTVINVKPSAPSINNTINLSVVNTGESATLLNANLTITRL